MASSLGLAADLQRVDDPSGDGDAFAEQNLPDGNNYEILSILGQGGMARVFKARDRDLDRLVALKVLRPDVPVSQSRFFREARSQARVVHDHVCRLYEVGRSAKGPFIAMQLVDGKPLAAVARELDLHDRLLMFCDVADAIQAAHRKGLLHRDLKPANVLLERRAGGWHAYVTDFGLARDLLKPGSTLEGTLIGSPLYMAPEQADARARLDARTDVYGLGATLYELLVGRPPFLGASSLQVLYRTLHEDPVPPRKLDRALAVGLERVVLQCLEKAPERRYPSAEALAEDLRRHLRGERVHARRQGAIGRFRRVVARNPAVSSLSILALALAVALVVSGILAARRERAVAAAAHSFGERVRAAESIVRIGSLLPLHDLRRERQQAREQLAAIEQEMSSMRPEVAALGEAALGRGYLGLQDYDRARAHLELALRWGRGTAGDRFALGLALGEVYARELERAQMRGGAKARKDRAKELENELRVPALSNLRAVSASEGEPAAPEYVEALIAHHERRYEDALSKARAALARSPSLYEAKRLEGDVLVNRGIDEALGAKWKQATVDFEAAGLAYAAATDIARSDPAIYEADCRREVMVFQAASILGGDPSAATAASAAAAAGVPACDRALAVDPDSSDARLFAANFHFRVGEWRMDHGQNPHAEVQKLFDLTRAVLQREPLNVAAWEFQGVAWDVLGSYQYYHGIDPRPSFEREMAAVQEAIRIEPSFAQGYAALGATNMSIALVDSGHGIDPTPRLAEASAAMRRAIELDHGSYAARVDLIEVEMARVRWRLEHGGNLTAPIEEIERLTREVVERAPAIRFVAVSVCTAALFRGMDTWRRGSAPEAAFEPGIARCKAAIPPAPHTELLYTRAELEVEYARALIEKGRDPARALADADAALAAAFRRDAQNAEALRIRADASLARARWAKRKGRDPAAFFALAEGDAKHAIAINRFFDLAYRSIARIDAARLEWRRRQPALAAAEARRGLRDVRRALEVHPGWPELLALETLFKSVR